MIRRTFSTSQNDADIPSVSCSKTKSATATPQQPVLAMSDTPEDLLRHQHMLSMRHEGIISNEQSDDVQKGNDAETLNSIRTAHIERRRNTGQSWKSARMVRYQLNRNQTKGGIDYSFHWWMWVVYSHPKNSVSVTENTTSFYSTF